MASIKFKDLQANLIEVLSRLPEVMEGDEGLVYALASAVEEVLDDHAMDDGFGTERQSDPRGDFRDGEWSIYGEIQL